MAVTPEERDLGRMVYRAVIAVDGVFRSLAADVVRIVRDFPLDRRGIMRQVDRLIDRAFGLTQRAALVSELLGVIIRATDAAAERPFLRALERVRSIVTRRDPSLWGGWPCRDATARTAGGVPRPAAAMGADRWIPALRSRLEAGKVGAPSD
jgi:hypothetical protein